MDTLLDMDTNYLVVSFILGVIGTAFFVFGKRQKRLVPLSVGLGLMVCPYFLSSLPLLIGVGVGLMATAYFVRG
jgi:hypothetical protein